MFSYSFKDYILLEKSMRNSIPVSASENTGIAAAGEHVTSARILKAAADAHRAAGNNDHADYLENKGKAHQDSAQKLLHGKHPQLVADVLGRSHHVAKEFINHHKSEGRSIKDVHDVHHTAKAGDVQKVTGRETNQTSDPSDMIIHYKKGNKDDFHGISYKHNISNTLGTPGTKSIDDSLGTSHTKNHLEFQAKMKKKYGDKYSSKDARKDLQKSSPEAKNDAKEFAEKSAKHTHEAFSKANPEKQREHMRSFFKMNPKVPYTLVKGYGTGGNYGAKVQKHDDNEKGNAINNANRFSSEVKGSTTHYFAHTSDGKKHHLGYSEHRFTHSGFSNFGMPAHSK
jgi:hypothetical protein